MLSTAKAVLFFDTYCRYMKRLELTELGLVIKAKREAKGLTQHELAKKADVDRNYIGMLERGERNPSYMSLMKVANGLNMKIHQLIRKDHQQQ